MQQTINYQITRGTKKTLPPLIVDGDQSGREWIFCIKEDTELTTEPIFELNSLDNDLLNVVYNETEDTTSITPTINANETADLEAKKYYYDYTSINQTDSNDVDKPCKGYFVIVTGVHSEFEGMPLPDTDIERFTTLKAEDGEIGDLIQVTTDDDGNLVFDFVTLLNLKTQLDALE